MRTLYKLFLFLLTGTVFMACDNDDDKALSDLTLEMKVESSFFQNDTIVLSDSHLNEEAMKISWEQAADRGAGYTLDYIYRLDIGNNDFESSTDPESIEEGVFSKSYTNQELNDLMIEKWHVFPGDVAELDARIVAKVEGPTFLYPEIGTVKVKVQTYPPVSEPLYIVGTATEVGMDMSRAIRMDEISNGKYYAWKGQLREGDFKFLTSRESMLPSYNKGADNKTLVERISESDPDTYFAIGSGEPEGTYAIAVSRKELTIQYVYVPYENLYLIGNGCDADWELSNALAFTWDPMNPNIFTLQTDLKDGELKILTQRDWGSDTFRPMEDGDSIQETACQVYGGGDDLKWRVEGDEEGTYLITLNTMTNTIQFQKQ